jgi:hypothetical protein
VPVFLVGPRGAALLGSPHRWLGIGLRVSFVSRLVLQRARHCARRSFCFLGEPQLLQRRAQRWAQRSHRVCSPCGARNQRSATPCSSSRAGGRSKVNAFNAFKAFNACSRATFPFLSAAASSCSSCTFLPFRQPLPASSSCLRDSILADAQGTGSTQIGGFFKENHYS